MLGKSIKFLFVLMALILLLTPAWGAIPDATDAEDQALTFLRYHEVAGGCVPLGFLRNQPVLAKGGDSGGSDGGSGGSGGGFGNSNGLHEQGRQGTNAAQQNQNQNQYRYQYQHKVKSEGQNQHQHQQEEGSETQNQHKHQDQQREAPEIQN